MRFVQSALLFAAVLLLAAAPSLARAQNAGLDEVRAANAAYYAALSARDIAAMEKIWSPAATAVNIAPPVKPAPHVGWEAIRKNYLGFWGTLDQLTVAMDQPVIVTQGDAAWVYGIENTQRRAKSGQASGGSNFGTSIFVKQDGRWRMVFHEAAAIPQGQQKP